MAQIAGDTIYITAAEEITLSKKEVRGIIITPTSGAVAPHVILTDTGGSKAIKVELR